MNELLKRCSYWEINTIVAEYKEIGEATPIFCCVARSHPKWWKGQCFNSLAPSKRLLDSHIKDKIAWEDYVEQFMKEMKNSEVVQQMLMALWKQTQSQDVYLVCWERTEPSMMDTHCHTVLLIDYTNELATEQRWYC